MAVSSEPTIQVDLAGSASQLLAYDGRPVWPAPTRFARSAIEQAAALAGTQVEIVRAVEAGEPDGLELVVGVGPTTAAVARLYAHLMGRRVAYAGDIESAVQSDPVVVVVMESDLTIAALDLLAARAARGQVIGVIAGHDVQSLLLQALIRSAATRASTTASTSRIAVLPTFAGPLHATGDDGVLDATATGVDIREALGSGAGVLTVMAHSDGVDANFGQLVLCPMDRTPADPDPLRLPHCRRVGRCHRAQAMAIDRWLEDPRRVAPEAIAARVLLYATCWGVVPSISFDDNAWSIGRRLLTSPRIGALVTSWEAHMYHPGDLLELARDVAAGLDLGTAVARLLSTVHSKQTGLRLCLLGDPRLRLRLPVAESPPPRSASSDGSSRPATRDRPANVPAPAVCFDSRAAAELAFLRVYVNAIAPGVTDRGLVDNALASIARYELAAARGLLAGGEDTAAAPWRDGVLDVLVWRGPLAIHNWTSLVRETRTRPTATACRHCQQRVITREYSLHLPDTGPRVVMTCAHCGVIADGPAPRSIAIAVRDDVVHLATDVSRNPWSARLAVYAKGERGPRSSLEWPAAADGWPARSMPVPAAVRTGTADVAVFLLHGVSWYIARVPVRF